MVSSSILKVMFEVQNNRFVPRGISAQIGKFE